MASSAAPAEADSPLAPYLPNEIWERILRTAPAGARAQMAMVNKRFRAMHRRAMRRGGWDARNDPCYRERLERQLQSHAFLTEELHAQAMRDHPGGNWPNAPLHAAWGRSVPWARSISC